MLLLLLCMLLLLLLVVPAVVCTPDSAAVCLILDPPPLGDVPTAAANNAVATPASLPGDIAILVEALANDGRCGDLHAPASALLLLEGDDVAN